MADLSTELNKILLEASEQQLNLSSDVARRELIDRLLTAMADHRPRTNVYMN